MNQIAHREFPLPILRRRSNVELMILSASGGLVYHVRALHGFNRWETTRRSVSELVAAWMRTVACEHLILFGPSGGYLIAHDLFGAIDLTVIDPDDIASLVFRRRFPSSRITWLARSDLLPFTSRAPEDFFNFLVGHAKPRTAVLFLGVLGQIDLHRNKFIRTKAEATRLLLAGVEKSGLPWASLHDLESAELSSAPPDDIFESLNQSVSSTEAAARIALLNVELAKVNAQPKSWLDHETKWLGQPIHTIPWFLSPKRLHILGWLTNP